MSARAGAVIVVVVGLVVFRAAHGTVTQSASGRAPTPPRAIGDRSGTGVVDGRIRASHLLRDRIEPPRNKEYERTGQRRTGPPQGPVARFAPTVPPTSAAGPTPAARSGGASGPAFSIFRSTIAGT